MGRILLVLLVILALLRWGRGFVSNVAVLLGIITSALASGSASPSIIPSVATTSTTSSTEASPHTAVPQAVRTGERSGSVATAPPTMPVPITDANQLGPSDETASPGRSRRGWLLTRPR